MTEIFERLRRKRAASMPLDNVEVGKRLKKIRQVLNYGKRGGQTRFAREIFNIENDRFSLWEKGQIEFPVYFAVQLVESGELSGLTLDWIYRGGFDLLRDTETARKLREAPDLGAGPAARRANRRVGKTSSKGAPRKRPT